MQHIETIELGSSQSSITFSSIPQDYDDLILLVSMRVSRNTSSFSFIEMQLNNDTNASNYPLIGLRGTGSGVDTDVSGAGIQGMSIGAVNQANNIANTFGNAMTYISNYTSSSAKSISSDAVNENNATFAGQTLIAGLYDTTSPITSISLRGFVPAGQFFDVLAGSTISLYGVTAGGDGTVTTA